MQILLAMGKRENKRKQAYLHAGKHGTHLPTTHNSFNMTYCETNLSLTIILCLIFSIPAYNQITNTTNSRTKHVSGIYKKPLKGKVTSTKYDIHLSDRFGNIFVVEELLANSTADICESNSHFTLAFEGGFTNAERQTICQVFADLSSQIDAQRGNILIKVIKQQLAENVIGVGSPIYLEKVDERYGSINNSLVWDLINTNADFSAILPEDFVAGVLRINNILPPAMSWHTIDMDDNAFAEEEYFMDNGFIDLYTVALHEALHILGFASRIMHDGSPYRGSYSRWDRMLFVKDEDLLDENHYDGPILSPSDSDCLSYEFSHGFFPEMPNDIQNDCTAEEKAFTIRFGGIDGAIINANYNSLAFDPDAEIRNSLSHINQDCEEGIHVMHYDIANGEHRRVISNVEKEILCQLGYSFTDFEMDCDGCNLVAVDDELLAQSMQFTITSSNLLLNDILPEDFDASSSLTLDFSCGNAQMIDIQPLSNGWRLQGLFPGQTYQFCYTITGCDSKCDQGMVNITYPPNYDLLPVCEVPACGGADLFCYGDFQDFEPGYHYPYYAQMDLENCHLYNPSYFNSPDLIMDNDDNIYAQVVNSGSNIEILTIPLSNAIQPGCELNLDFDYKRGFGSSAPTIQIFATAKEPCHTVGMPSINPFDETDYHYILSEGIAAAQYYWKNHPLIWINDTNEAINYITFINMKEGSGMSKLHLDNISATANCGQQVVVEQAVESICIGAEAVVRYEICIENLQNTTEAEVQLDMPFLLGVYPLSDEVTTLTFTEVASCQEVVMAFEIEDWVAEYSTLDFDLVFNAPHSCFIDGNVVSTSLNLEKCCTTPSAYFNAYANSCGQMTFNAVNEENTSHHWDFGDGSYSTAVHPTHIFAQSGDFTITHTTTNECATNTLVEVLTVEDCPIEMVCACPEEGFNIDAGEGTLLSTLNLPSTINGSCIAIKGHLIVDQEWTIRSSELKMQPASKITVSPYTFLNLYNNNENGGIHSCENMWQGIQLEPYANIKLINSIIQDAQYAIQTAHESSLVLENATFDRNYIGIHAALAESEMQLIRNKWMSGVTFSCSDKLLPAYNGQYPSPGVVTYAAIALENASLDMRSMEDYSVENIFTNIQNGIIATNSQVKISDARFENLMGYSGNTAQPGQLSGVGIILENSELDVEQSHFENIDRAIHSTNSRTTINQNTILNSTNAIVINGGNDLVNRVEENNMGFSNYGIFISGTNHPDSLLILNNAIQSNTVSSTYTGRAIFCLGMSPLGTGTKIIEDNELLLNNRANGISILNDGGYNISNNFVVYDQVNLSGYSTPSGISMGGSYNNYLYNNSVVSNHFSTKVNGFFISAAANNTFCCNRTDNTRSGFEFFGNCAQTKIRHSEIGSHRIGLKLGYGTILGDQITSGNRWVGTYTQYAARHYGNQTEVEQSQFYVDVSDWEYFPENAIYSNLPNWFMDGTSLALECSADEQCQAFDFGQLMASDLETLLIGEASLYPDVDIVQQNEKALAYYEQLIKERDITSTNLDAIYAIASQCPLQGGLTVYKARALYTLWAPFSIEEEVCQVESHKVIVSNKSGLNSLTTVFPNPASTFVQLKSSHENAIWVLTNGLGQTIMQIPLQNALKVHDLNITPLNTGLYFWSIRTADTILENGKLLVSQP